MATKKTATKVPQKKTAVKKTAVRKSSTKKPATELVEKRVVVANPPETIRINIKVDKDGAQVDMTSVDEICKFLTQTLHDFYGSLFRARVAQSGDQIEIWSPHFSHLEPRIMDISPKMLDDLCRSTAQKFNLKTFVPMYSAGRLLINF